MSVNLVLIGPPGSGKGTQALRISKRYKVPHISTGDILRQAVRDDTPLGREVAATIAGGSLVGDDLIADLVKARLSRSDTAPGFLLDGFPRTLVQARVLDTLAPDLLVVHIAVSSEEIVRRLSSRRICNSCSLTQSVSAAASAHGEDCPYCGGSLVRREDDDAATVRRRLDTDAAFAEPVIELYRQRPGFISVDGAQQPDQVSTALFEAIDRLRR